MSPGDDQQAVVAAGPQAADRAHRVAAAPSGTSHSRAAPSASSPHTCGPNAMAAHGSHREDLRSSGRIVAELDTRDTDAVTISV